MTYAKDPTEMGRLTHITRHVVQSFLVLVPAKRPALSPERASLGNPPKHRHPKLGFGMHRPKLGQVWLMSPE